MEFKNINVNPKNRKAADCVVRAISFAIGIDYWNVVDDLVKVYKKTGYMINEKKCYTKYLENLGYEMRKQPRKADNTKYTVEEFVDRLALNNKTYILKLANHLTVVKGNNLYDIWNCSGKTVGNYWEVV